MVKINITEYFFGKKIEILYCSIKIFIFFVVCYLFD